MVQFNNRCKSALLVLALLITAEACPMAGMAEAVQSAVKSAGQSIVAYAPSKLQLCGVVLIAMYIRLHTKGTNWDYKKSDFEKDCKDTMASFNIFDAELYQQLVKMFDKWCIGRKFEVLDVVIKEDKVDGVSRVLKGDKKVKSAPFGALALVDCYFLMQLEKLGKIGTNLTEANKFTSYMFDVNLKS